MVDFGAPPKQNDCEDIASAEGASQKNLTNLTSRYPKICTRSLKKPRVLPYGCVKLHKPKYREKGFPSPQKMRGVGGKEALWTLRSPSRLNKMVFDLNVVKKRGITMILGASTIQNSL